MRHGRVRPIAIAPGAAAFALAWIGGLAVARLTGAAAVLLVLAALVAALACALLDGWRQVRAIGVVAVELPALVEVGRDAPAVVTLRHSGGVARPRRPVVVRFRDTAGAEVGHRRLDAASGSARRGEPSSEHVVLRFSRAGIVDELEIEIATAGTSGLVWWARRTIVAVATIHVAPVPDGPNVAVVTSPASRIGDGTVSRGPRRGEIDGVRPWRDGEPAEAVHWPTTVRSGSLMVHDHTAASETCWTVALPPPADAGRFLGTLRLGLQTGHDVRVELPERDDPLEIRTVDDAARIAAVAAATPAVTERPRWWRREVHLGRSSATNPESTNTVIPVARWLTALASWLGLTMLVGALSGPVTTTALIGAGLAAGAIVTTRFVDESGEPPLFVRCAVVAASIGALALVAVESSGITGLLAALRGPLPDLLMMLVVLHGFEASNRRTVRVHQAIGAAIVLYAAGLRIDGALGWWLAAWGVAFVAAITSTAAEPGNPAGRGAGLPVAPRTGPRERMRAGVRVGAWVVGAAVLTIGVLAVVPVPRGPASLGLPALSTGTPSGSPGALVGADGDPAPGAPTTNDRGALGTIGGYLGFSATLDTSIRGGLGDDVVMRVRAPEPAFWRGQTFVDFDGRTWTVSPEQGRANTGPTTTIRPTLGDDVAPTVGTDELVQTYFIEADLPNVVFAAARPSTIVFDGTIWTRPDGALRSDVTLGDGSAYTVVSERARVTADVLRRQGDVAMTFAAIDDPRADALLAPYLAVPKSTSQRTRDLAGQLAPAGQSTYDTILAYEAWLAANTSYDLDAPVPADGVDAVDDFLFESRRGFCEQIASALTVMLRTQGVPARLATGYLPGERDRVSGVWKVRASDAHAWVEVWFPESGWQAFDPTADVPLAGDAGAGTVGHDLLAAAVSSVASHPVEVATTAAVALAAVAAWRLLSEAARRRRRGRWGLLQDRFAALGDDPFERRDRSEPATNPRLAAQIATRLATRLASRPSTGADADRVDAAGVEVQARRVAEALDRAAFDPTWTDDDESFESTALAVRSLEFSGR